MSSYAGYSDLGDYITRRCASQRPPISFNELSLALKKSHGYIHALATGLYQPSIKGADAIADYFGDNRKIVRILAGLEMPPTDEDKLTGEIKELAANLPQAGRRELLEFASFLAQKYAPKNGAGKS